MLNEENASLFKQVDGLFFEIRTLFYKLQVRIYRELALTTGGEFSVCLDDCHFRDLLHAQLEPPPSTAATEPSLIKMGFPCHAGITCYQFEVEKK